MCTTLLSKETLDRINAGKHIIESTTPINVDYQIGNTIYNTIECDGSDNPTITYDYIDDYDGTIYNEECNLLDVEPTHLALILDHIAATIQR